MKDEIKFQNRYDADIAMMKEYAKYVFCKSTRILGMILMLISAAAFAISLGMGYQLSESVLFILCFLGGLIIYSYYILIVKVMGRQMKGRKGGKVPECVIDFKEDGIKMTQGTAEAKYEYQDIKKIHNLPGIYALSVANNQAILVKKGAFSKGREEQFEQFIQKKLNKVE